MAVKFENLPQSLDFVLKLPPHSELFVLRSYFKYNILIKTTQRIGENVYQVSNKTSLGAGKLDDYDDFYEPPEEEIDQLNDETFGAGAEDGDWEEQHEKFSGKKADVTKSAKSYLSPEEQLEQSISQLVVDDDEEFSDPAVINASRGRPIPKKAQNLDELFGPASPPAFMDMETLVSPTSRNIWGSPARDTSFSKPVHTIQSLFDFAKAAEHAFDEPTVYMSPTKPAVTGNLPQAMTVEELEGRILGKTEQAPKVFSAEELERQMRGEVIRPRRKSHHEYHHQPTGEDILTPFSLPMPIPLLQGRTSPADFHQMPPGMSPLARTSLDGRISPAQVVPRGRITPPMPVIGSPMIPHTPPFHRGSPMNILGRSVSPSPIVNYPIPSSPTLQPLLSTPITQALNLNFSLGVIGSRAATPNQVIAGMPNGLPHSMGRGGHGMPYGSPGMPSIYGSPVSQPRIPFPMPYSDPSHLARTRGMQQHQQFQLLNRSLHHPPMNRPPPTNGTIDNREVDEYAGIMTKKEKDWIIKIQLLQLQTDNPYLDDFYYTNFSLKKKVRERIAREKKMGIGTNEEDPTLVLPALAKIEAKSYRPAQFEGSLGRLTSSSVHNPRQIIDLKPLMVPSDEPEGQTKCVSRELRKFRQLLMDIEKCYIVLLEIDDIEKKVLVLPDESRKPLFDERKAKINQLYKTVYCPNKKDEILTGVLTVRKGRKLLARIIPLLEQDQSVSLSGGVLRNILLLMKKDVIDDSQPLLFGSLALVISNSDLAALTTLTGDLQSSTKSVPTALQNKFGSSVIYTLLSQGDTIYTSSSVIDLDSDQQAMWTQFVQFVAESIENVPSSSLARQAPSAAQQQDKIRKHFEKLLSPDLVASVEDKMKNLVVKPS